MDMQDEVEMEKSLMSAVGKVSGCTQPDVETEEGRTHRWKVGKAQLQWVIGVWEWEFGTESQERNPP